jgi:hypothetical protein
LGRVGVRRRLASAEMRPVKVAWCSLRPEVRITSVPGTRSEVGRKRSPEPTTNASDCTSFELSMPRNRRLRSGSRIQPDVVLAAVV